MLKSRTWKIFHGTALFFAAWAFSAWALRPTSNPISDFVFRCLLSLSTSAPPTVPHEVQRILWSAGSLLSVSYQAALWVATVLLPLGFLARTIARAHVRASLPDPLDRARRFVARRWGNAILAAPALAWSALLFGYFAYRNARQQLSTPTWDEVLFGFGIPAVVAFIGHRALLKRAAHAVLAPTLKEGEAAQQEATAEGFTFDAVAVTRETRGAVAAHAALSIAMTVVAASLPITNLMRDPRFATALIAYLVVAAGSAIAFRRTSRISIGVDGILIGGSSRKRFFSYRDIDGSRARGGDLELLRGDKVVLRLQLHGKDATRREALLARLQDAITRASEARRDPATGFVEAASTEELTLAAAGAATYRGRTAPTREKLWELLEGPAIDSDRRRAAATALARTAVDAAESERLRVAAEQFAEPSARSGIHDLLEGEEEEEEDSARDSMPFLPKKIARR